MGQSEGEVGVDAAWKNGSVRRGRHFSGRDLTTNNHDLIAERSAMRPIPMEGWMGIRFDACLRLLGRSAKSVHLPTVPRAGHQAANLHTTHPRALNARRASPEILLPLTAAAVESVSAKELKRTLVVTKLPKFAIAEDVQRLCKESDVPMYGNYFTPVLAVV